MNRVTGYKCIFAEQRAELEICAGFGTGAGHGGDFRGRRRRRRDFLDMLGDATEVLFDPATHEVNFVFGFTELEDEEEEEVDEDGKAKDDEDGDDAERNAA